MGKMTFLSYMDKNSAYTMRQMTKLANGNQNDIKDAIDEGMISMCEENLYGEELFKITNIGIKYRNN